jgi:uncharacterized membrane protein YeaQ/YmgE (transglycosylase-associated protein family)
LLSMLILTWIILGLGGGWIASRVLGSGGYGILGDSVVGVVGAVAGGWLGLMLLGLGRSEPLSVVGAVVLIAAFRALSPSRHRV